MKKTIYALFLLVVCIFTFSVTPAFAQVNENPLQTNAFRIVRKGYKSGQISLSYIFPLNSSLLENQGFSSEEIGVLRFYLTSYVNALSKSNAENVCEGVSVEKSKYYTDVDGIGFSILFKDLDAQKRFFGVSDENSSSEQKNKTSGFFVRKTTINSTFPISSSKSAGDLKMVCLLAISAWGTNNSISKDRQELVSQNYQGSCFIYDFALEERGLKSDLMYEDENFHHNVFIKTFEDIENGETKISFHVTTINTPVWYISAIIVVGVGMVVSYFVLRMREKRKKSK